MLLSQLYRYNFVNLFASTCHYISIIYFTLISLISYIMYHILVVGFKHFLFSIIYGITRPIDVHIFQRGRLKHQPVYMLHPDTKSRRYSKGSFFVLGLGLSHWFKHEMVECKMTAYFWWSNHVKAPVLILES